MGLEVNQGQVTVKTACQSQSQLTLILHKDRIMGR